MPPPKLTVKVRPWGPDAGAFEEAARRVARNPAFRKQVEGADHRVLSLRLAEPERKEARPRRPDQFVATVVDYSNHRSLQVKGSLQGGRGLEVADSARHPHVSYEEFEAAVEIVRRNRDLGGALRKGALKPYRPMPPFVAVELADGREARHVTVGLLAAEKGASHEIVAVDIGRRRVTRFAGGAPATARAAGAVCGVPVNAGQATATQGTPGQALVTVSRGNTLLWEFMVVRPAASSGFWGSGVELRHVRFKGKSVLYQAHVPILNVRYDGDRCGPYRDWQWQEGRIQATGTDVAPGFRHCPTKAKTIVESGTDTGNFLGVGIYVAGQEVVLVSELEAGWYRYISEWRLHANGQIRPRFRFAATESSCVCIKHHHHVYWRLDFDVDGVENRLREFNDPPLVPGKKWQTLPFEVKRMRSAARKRRWRVENELTGKGYGILPGPFDRTAAGDPYAKGDLWALRYRANQIDDHPITGTQAELDKFINHESIQNEDIVVWYGAHFTHDVHRHGAHGAQGHVVGPTLVSYNW
jgi:hypothetical protein